MLSPRGTTFPKSVAAISNPRDTTDNGNTPDSHGDGGLGNREPSPNNR